MSHTFCKEMILKNKKNNLVHPRRALKLLIFLGLSMILGAGPAAETFSGGGDKNERNILNGREVCLDGEDTIVSWISPDPAVAYRYMIELTVEFLKNDMVYEHGYPYYYCRPAYYREPPHEGRDWHSNPGDNLATFIDSYVQDYYAFTGDSELKEDVIDFACYMIEEGSTPSDQGWDWPGCPYQQDYGGTLPSRASDRGGAIMPSLVGKLGAAYVRLYQATENPDFLSAAVSCADALAANARPGTANLSPWPWRVMPETNEVYEQNEYCAYVVGPINLFQALIEMGYDGGGAYVVCRDAALTWLFSEDGPMSTGNWSNYFEDMPYFFDNHCQITLGETARFLIEHPELDADWQQHVEFLIGEMEDIFGEYQYGAITMNEQIGWYYPMTSHSARYASICARYFELTVDPTYKEKAYRSLNWTTYGSCPEKERVVVQAMDRDHGWFTDCHGDYVQHIFAAMGAVPEWAPRNENHLLRSSSIVQYIEYNRNSIHYRTFDAESTEVFRMSTKPETITVDGTLLNERQNLDQPGWTWDGSGLDGTCTIYHETGRNIELAWRNVPALSQAGLLLLVCSLTGTITAAYRMRNSDS